MSRSATRGEAVARAAMAAVLLVGSLLLGGCVVVPGRGPYWAPRYHYY